jgi:two-component system, NarL family, response regulator NreC
MTVRILIADDHGVLRAGLRSLLRLEPGMEVIGEAGDGNETMRLAEELRPDVVLLDISMPGADGIAVTRNIRNRCPEVKLLMLTAHEDQTLLLEAMRAGAAGYVVKRALDTELTGAIAAVARGDYYVHPSMTRALLNTTSPQVLPGGKDYEEILTPREVQVLRLLAQGNTNNQVADALALSVRTVESHRANIMDKLHLRNRAELVRYARDKGLLPNT